MPDEQYTVTYWASYEVAINRITEILRELNYPEISEEFFVHQVEAENALGSAATKQPVSRQFDDGDNSYRIDDDEDASQHDWNHVYYNKRNEKSYTPGNAIELTLTYNVSIELKIVALDHIDFCSHLSNSKTPRALEAQRRVINAIRRVDERNRGSGLGPLNAEVHLPGRPAPVPDGYRVGPFSFMKGGVIWADKYDLNLLEVVKFKELTWEGYGLLVVDDDIYLITKPGECYVRIQFYESQWFLVERKSF